MSSLACDACLRRSWLLARLSGPLDVAWRQRRPLPEVLALPDVDLIAGLAGSAQDAVAAELTAFDAQAARARLQRGAVSAVCRHRPEYPEPLRPMADAPAVLHLAGDPARLARALERPVVAVVGARRASAYGLSVARELARAAAQAGACVVSGLALGADAAAHEGALDGGGLTLAVLGGGADVPYPASKHRLHARIRAEGLVLAELPPGTGVRRWCFPARNRIIAGLAQLTVVVEAAAHSGSLITAALARDLGREVGAVPGRITSTLAAGTNGLIADGAHVIRGVDDVLDALFGVGVARPGPTIPPELPADLRALLTEVSDGRDTLDLLAPTAAEVGPAAAGLADLELRGLLRRGPGGRYTVLAYAPAP